jgi:4-aminobutyrate aminotransferase/(S)-3-amino-2-methylpropionate transaminase
MAIDQGTGTRTAELQAERERWVSASVATQPIFVDHAHGARITDVEGREFIDFVGGIGSLNCGHTPAAVVAAVQEQAARYMHQMYSVVQYEGYIETVKRMVACHPGAGPFKGLLLNSGAEAVENAVKIARAYTKRQAVVVFDHGYHGRTNLTMALTAKNMPYKQSFGPFASEVYRMPMSSPFRDGPHTGAEVASWATTKMEKEIGGANIAAIIIEPIQGEGGFIVPAPGFLPALKAYAEQHGIVFVADEIQSGFCRTGQWFASEHEGVVPDLITTAKGIAGGLPLAGVTGRAEIMDAVHVGGLGGTYGGNPIACAAALGSIEAMEEEDLNARALAIESIMRERLEALQAAHPEVGDIRGRGAMIAIELVKPGTMDPDPELAGRVSKAAHAQGVVTLTCGTYGNVLRFLPPLTIPDDLLREGLDVVAAAFDA